MSVAIKVSDWLRAEDGGENKEISSVDFFYFSYSYRQDVVFA